MVQTKEISLHELHSNTGQIDGLPKNPRFIKDDKYQKLKQSIEEAPEMLQLRELIVIPFAGSYVVIAGNMRLKVMQELGYETAICKVLPENTPAEKLREYTIKDNISYGQMDWEIAQSDWDIEEFYDWGEDIPEWVQEDEEEENYGDLDEEDQEALKAQSGEMQQGVKKAIMIEFNLEDYEKAFDLVKYWREQGAYVGSMIIEYLENEKKKAENV